MEKRDLKYQDILSHFLAPGDIYWRQRTGTLLCVNKRGEPLNIDLIHKLFEGEQNLIITNEADSSFEESFMRLFERYKEALLVKEKLVIRKEIITMFVKVANSHLNHFDFAMLGWRIFSKIEHELRRKLIKGDSDLFKRSVCVASSTCYLAFMVGYYDLDFLSKVFSSVLVKLTGITTDANRRDFKLFFEEVRHQEVLSEEDSEKMKHFLVGQDRRAAFFYEKANGSGMMGINAREMTDLDLIIIAMNKHYSYESFDMPNIFKQVLFTDIDIERHLMEIIKKEFKRAAEIAAIEGGHAA